MAITLQGVSINPDFITSEQEDILIHIIEDLFDKHIKINSKSKNRDVLRFGKQTYSNNNISTIIPKTIRLTAAELDSDSISINRYRQGKELDWHIDNEKSGENIKILSLLSNGTMLFRKSEVHTSIHLPRRSLMILTDDARWNWEHKIPPVRELRYSIVFRKVKI